jgi:hypothetical protein
MAIRENLCTPQDVRNLSEIITNQVRDDARVIQFIQKEDPIIRAGLRALYANGDTDLLNPDGPWNGPPQKPYPYVSEATGNLVQNEGDADLVDVTPSSTAVTELWTLTFSSETAFSVWGSTSGAKEAGVTGSDYDNSLIAIPAANWDLRAGTPDANDQFFVSTYRFDPLIVALSAKMAAAQTLRATTQGVSDEIIAESRRIYKEAQELLKQLQQPYMDTGFRLGTFAARDISPEGIAYAIDETGVDVTQYADNARTTQNEARSQAGLAFFWGPTW